MKTTTATKTPLATFRTFPMNENWVTGDCANYFFEAKLYDDPSDYGIHEGRVSKLTIWDANYKHKIVMNFDRGWDLEPSKKVEPFFEAIMALLEAAPKRWA